MGIVEGVRGNDGSKLFRELKTLLGLPCLAKAMAKRAFGRGRRFGEQVCN